MFVGSNFNYCTLEFHPMGQHTPLLTRAPEIPCSLYAAVDGRHSQPEHNSSTEDNSGSAGHPFDDQLQSKKRTYNVTND